LPKSHGEGTTCIKRCLKQNVGIEWEEEGSETETEPLYKNDTYLSL